MSPTGRAALLLAGVALSALLLPETVVALLALAVMAATLTDALLARSRVDVTRTLPRVLARGVAAPLQLSFEGSVPSSRVRLRQAGSADLRISEHEAVGSLTTTVVARRRGAHTLPPPAVRVDGPLGLARWFRSAGSAEAVTVYPDLPAAQRLAAAVRRGRFRVEGNVRGPLGLGTEFESVRDYEPDDDVRQVNWRASQRMGRPMSNQYRVECDRDIICVVDCGRLMAAPLGDRTRLDAAVDAAVAVAAVADALGDRCGALAFDANVRRDVRPRRAGGKSVLSALFDVEPVSVESDYAEAFGRIVETKRAWVLVLTDLLESAAARPLLDALPTLARRHAVAVASAADPDLDRVLREPPALPADVYRTAVAFDVFRARAAVSAELLHRGVDVIDAPADQLAAACVRAYLRAKERALL